jgi:hypothetical protein
MKIVKNTTKTVRQVYFKIKDLTDTQLDAIADKMDFVDADMLDNVLGVQVDFHFGDETARIYMDGTDDCCMDDAVEIGSFKLDVATYGSSKDITSKFLKEKFMEWFDANITRPAVPTADNLDFAQAIQDAVTGVIAKYKTK